MRVLAIGCGGVGTAAALIAKRRDFFEAWFVADYDLARATALRDRLDDPRFEAAKVDASSIDAVAQLCRMNDITHVVNFVDPRFVMSIFQGALVAQANYLDTAMSLSAPHPDSPHSLTGVKLGDAQFDLSEKFANRGLVALCGMGVEPGLSDVFARYAADHLFDSIDQIGVRDGADLEVAGHAFAPTFSIWTMIEECLNPPVVWERERGWFTTEPFSGAEEFTFPEGIGTLTCVNVEHEEVLLIPRWIDCNEVTFKYGLGDKFIDVLSTLHELGLDSVTPVSVKGTMVSPRDVVAAVLPDPLTLGDKMSGRTCAGTWVTGTKDGKPRDVYLYHVTDNEWSMREYGAQAVVWQTAMNPVIALELLASGTWSGRGVVGPEAFDAVPYLDLMRDGYGQAFGIQERT